MLDAGYDIVDSPIGPLLVAASDRGLLRISFDADPEEQLERLVAGRRPPDSALPESGRRRPP